MDIIYIYDMMHIHIRIAHSDSPIVLHSSPPLAHYSCASSAFSSGHVSLELSTPPGAGLRI